MRTLRFDEFSGVARFQVAAHGVPWDKHPHLGEQENQQVRIGLRELVAMVDGLFGQLAHRNYYEIVKTFFAQHLGCNIIDRGSTSERAC
jgi:hypothetical protein